ncbi:MAG: phosphoribosyltransferase family protein, partial [Pseudomonadota bacterium]
MTPDYEIDTLISEAEISERLEALAAEINAAFADTTKLVVVGLLRGSFIFIADLVRKLDVPVEIDFIEASSYGDSTESSREVRILKDLRGEIEGRDVLVVEDIVDTGHTLSRVMEILRTRRPARLE